MSSAKPSNRVFSAHTLRPHHQWLLCFLTFSLFLLPPSVRPAESVEYTMETVVMGLNYPWAMAHLPGGDILITERGGGLKRIQLSDGSVQQITGTPEVYLAGQGGLMDIVLSPDFELDHTLFLSYAHGDASANATAVLRARLDGNSLVESQTIFIAQPLKDTAVHYGARMAFLPDGSMLLSIGDGFEMREEAQRPETHLGSILKITVDGAAAKDNPDFGNSALPEIYSIGHRNSQALLYDAQTDTIFSHEHGPRGGDEINIIKPGRNYGWPIATSGVDYSGARISPWSTHEGYEAPLTEWSPSIAPSGMTLYRGDAFADWNGDLFVAALAAREVRRVRIVDGAVTEEERLFDELNQRIRDISTGPDGLLYLLTDSSSAELVRVSPRN